MAFISGPRQCGKTTLSKIILKTEKFGHYYNWDDISFRKTWTKNPSQILSKDKAQIIILDEIHKAKGWKRTLKGIYDTQNKENKIIVTGSARLNIFKKGSDSLMGRYYNFRLHPFSLGELFSNQNHSPNEFLSEVLKNKKSKRSEKIFSDLMTYGGFPEPFLSQSEKISRIWRRGRIEKIVREDLRDLSRLPELSQIEMLISLLPERAGQQLSRQSLSEDLEVSYDTIKRWLNYLSELYYQFTLQPWSKSIPRSIKKEGKLYLWDWSEITEPGHRFENLVANHLLKACHYWTDTGEGHFELFYLRKKGGKEIDFLIVKDKKPWLPIECKSSNTIPTKNIEQFLPHIKTNLFIQIVQKTGVHKIIENNNQTTLVTSADKVLRFLP